MFRQCSQRPVSVCHMSCGKCHVPGVTGIYLCKKKKKNSGASQWRAVINEATMSNFNVKGP